MRLLFIRHAIAESAKKSTVPDADRPLTVDGERRFVQVARRLSDLGLRPSAIMTSPLLRARQTADIAAQAFGGIKPTVLPALVDGDWTKISRALANFHADDTVVLVGHENWISALTARLLGSRSRRAFEYRKGGAGLIELDHPSRGRGKLLWFIPPRVLRRL